MTTKKKILLLALGNCFVLALLGMTVVGYVDMLVYSVAPGSPSSGYQRTYTTSSGWFCKDSSGNSCAPIPNGVNAQSASYTAVSGDAGKLISMNCGSSCTLTLPAAPPFARWWIAAQSIGAGTVTVSRNSLNIDGAASNLSLTQGLGVIIFTDGSNYFTSRGMSGSGGITLQTNGVNNGSQTTLNLAAGSNMTLTDNGSGTITFDASGTGGGGALTKITETVLGGTAATVTFSSFSGYRNIILIVTARSDSGGTRAQDAYVQFNGDTGANYSRVFVNTSFSGNNISTSKAPLFWTSASLAPSGMATSAVVRIFAYTSSWLKNVRVDQVSPLQLSAGNPGLIPGYSYFFWNSTATITSMTLGMVDGSNFVAGSIFSLYGES